MKFGFGIVGIPKRGGGPLVKPAPGSVIATQHPLAQGLVASYPLNGTTRDYVRMGRGTLAAGAVLSADGLDATASTARLEVPTVGMVSEGTILFRFRNVATPADFGKFCVTSDGAFQFYRGGNATTLDLFINWTGAGVSGPSVWDGSWYSMAASWNDAANARAYYTNGLLYVAVNASAFTWDAPTLGNTLYIGNRSAGDRTVGGIFEYFNIYSRALNPSEIANLHAEPYCMFWLPGARTIFIPLETGGGTIIPSIRRRTRYGYNKNNIIFLSNV